MAEDKNTFEEDVESAEFITLEYEDGTSERCEVLGVFDVEEKQYVALAPEEDETSVYLYGYNSTRTAPSRSPTLRTTRSSPQCPRCTRASWTRATPRTRTRTPRRSSASRLV